MGLGETSTVIFPPLPIGLNRISWKRLVSETHTPQY